MNSLSAGNSKVLVVLFYTVLLIPMGLIMRSGIPENNLVRMLVIDLALTFLVFIAGLIVHNDSVYDPYWSVFPLFILFYWIYTPENIVFNFRSIAMIVLVFAWSLRLTGNWLQGWKGFGHEDWRYTDLRKKFPKIYPLIALGGIYLLPTLLVFLAALPVQNILTADTAMGFADIAGVLIILSGIVLETISDRQLRSFRKNPENKNKVMDKGLWKYSRHPNYLGEILFWSGLYVLSLGAEPKLYIASGWLAMLLLFNFISIPMMEKRQIEKKPAYRDYMQKTPRLFPFKL